MRTFDYFKNDAVSDLFFIYYYSIAKKYYSLKEEMDISRVDASVLDSIELNHLYRYKDIMEILKRNCSIRFIYPEGVEGNRLDYTNQDVQYVQFNHIGVNTEVPYPIEYYFKCNFCGAVVKYTELPRNYSCPAGKCPGKLVHDQQQDVFANLHASQIMCEQKSIPAVSMVEMPVGEFSAATLLCRDMKSTEYFAFILAIEEKKYEKTDLDIVEDTHVVWQLIDKIDSMHEERAQYHIDGMDYYKAAILMAAIANFSGFKSYNILIAGKSGGAKTVTPRWYHNTISLMCKVQDVVSVSLPGLIGSTATVTLNNRNIKICEPGLLSRNEFVVLDEIYNPIDEVLMGQLKGALSSATMSKEVHANRMEMDKNASVVATANIEPAVYNKVRREFNKLVQSYLESPDTYGMLGPYEQEAYELLRFSNDPIAIVSKTLELRECANGINWIDGKSLSNIERFGLPFYVGNPMTPDDDTVPDHIFDDTNVKITTPALQKLVYSQEIRDYLQFCSQIKVLHSDTMMLHIKKFVSKLWKHDHIHSKARGMQNILKTLEFSAMICGRDCLNDMDFDFVEQLFGLTCRWVEVEDLRRDSTKHIPCVYDRIDEDRLEPVSGDIELFIGSKFQKYDLFGKGRDIWDRAITNIRCDLTTKFAVDDPVIAEKHIKDYIKKHVSFDSNLFDSQILPGCSGNGSGDDIVTEEDNNVHVEDDIDDNVTKEEEIETLYFKSCDKNEKLEYFKDAVLNPDAGVLLGMLIDEFAKHKSIPKEVIDSYCETNMVELSDMNVVLSQMKKTGMICDVGDAFNVV